MVRLAHRSSELPAADATLDRALDEILRVCTPELVLLFGSRAYGTPRADSDYDLMIVVPDAVDAAHVGGLCQAAIRDLDISADVFGRGVSQYRRQQHDPGFMDWLVSREGRVVYATGRVAQREAAPAAPRVREEFESVALWRERALADLRLARMTLAASTPVPDAICFHAHAAVEKLLKAEIVARGVHPPRTHVLKSLLVLLPAGRIDAELRADCALLDALYPRSRYPELPMPELEDARRAFAAALRARSGIRHSPESGEATGAERARDRDV